MMKRLRLLFAPLAVAWLLAGAAVNVAVAPQPAAAQSGCPYIVYGAVLTPGQWNACFAAKVDTSAATGFVRGSGAVTGGNIACWAGVWVVVDCGAVPTVLAGTGITVTPAGHQYTVSTTASANQSANLVYAGPASGGAATPTFRALVTADLPSVGVTGGPTGTGALVPVLTYAKGQLTAVTTTAVTPAAANITGLGTGVAAALAVNVGTAGAPVVNGGALGTPSSGVGTNLTGTASGLTAGNVTTNANLTGDVTSVGNATTVKASVSLTTPVLNVATATSINGTLIPTTSGDTVVTLARTSQALTGGFAPTSVSLGTKTSGTTTINCGTGPQQYLTNGGAFTLAAPANDSNCLVMTINNGSAGAITFSGFTVGTSTGDALDTTNAHIFTISVWRINGTSGYRIAASQ